jgi:hypothetical protein
MYLDRQDEQRAFETLTSSAGDAWLLLYHGLNGLGKTTLLEHLRAGLPGGWVPMDLDFGWKTYRKDYDSVLRELTRHLTAAGLPQQALDAYRQREREVEKLKIADLEVLKYASPGSTIRDSTQIVDTGKEVALQYREAGSELAYTLPDLLGHFQDTPILFLDHWDMLLDKAEERFATWLFEELVVGMRRRRPGFRAVIASDRPKDADWLLNQRLKDRECISHELKPLAPEHARTLMEDEGLADATVQATILDKVDGNPLLVKLAVGLWREQPELDLSGLSRRLDSRAATDWFLKRICENLADGRTKKALERGIVLQHFTLDTLQAVCELPGLDNTWYTRFVSRPFVQRSAHRPSEHEFQRTVRTVQLGHLWQSNRRGEEGFHYLHGKALRWYRSLPGAEG